MSPKSLIIYLLSSYVHIVAGTMRAAVGDTIAGAGGVDADPRPANLALDVVLRAASLSAQQRLARRQHHGHTRYLQRI